MTQPMMQPQSLMGRVEAKIEPAQRPVSLKSSRPMLGCPPPCFVWPCLAWFVGRQLTCKSTCLVFYRIETQIPNSMLVVRLKYMEILISFPRNFSIFTLLCRLASSLTFARIHLHTKYFKSNSGTSS